MYPSKSETLSNRCGKFRGESLLEFYWFHFPHEELCRCLVSWCRTGFLQGGSARYLQNSVTESHRKQVF